MRGPKHVVTKGATPVLTPAETRELLDRIDTETLVGLRDRALLSVMVFSFARVSAAVGMRLQDYFRQGVRGGCRCTRTAGSGTTCPPTTGPLLQAFDALTPTGSRRLSNVGAKR